MEDVCQVTSYYPPSQNPVGQRAFFGFSVLVFAASVALTIIWCDSMPGMGEMTMPGGWSMSMAWMRMPGQTWIGAGASFVGMWGVMMIAMMLPCLLPMLWRYRRAVDARSETTRGWLTILVGIGYFFVWTGLGIVIFPAGAALAELEMQLPALSRAVPIAVAVVVLIAGAFQFTPLKAQYLACCRGTPRARLHLPADASTAWRHGLRLGLQCCCCCAGLMTILLVIGVMDLFTMAVVTVAITAERLAPGGERIAQGIGVIVIAAGLFMIVRACGIG